ncbi:MAG: dynamin family protein, partial [Chthonomonadales bacterium]|nr:dynamin family protein [Chthonomonadales bacterium]
MNAENGLETGSDTLESLLASLLETLAACGRQDLNTVAEALAERQADPAFRITLLSEPKRGKSSLLNALFGAELLPTSPLPTLLDVDVRWGESLRFVLEGNPVSQEISLEALAKLPSVEDFDSTPRLLTVYFPLEICRKGVILAERTLNGDAQRHDHLLAESDALCFVFSSEMAVSMSEKSVIERAHTLFGHENLVFVSNRIDRVRKAEEERLRSFVRTSLLPFSPSGAPTVFFLSALKAVEAKENGEPYETGSEFPDFERALQTIAAADLHERKISRVVGAVHALRSMAREASPAIPASAWEASIAKKEAPLIVDAALLTGEARVDSAPSEPAASDAETSPFLSHATPPLPEEVTRLQQALMERKAQILTRVSQFSFQMHTALKEHLKDGISEATRQAKATVQAFPIVASERVQLLLPGTERQMAAEIAQTAMKRGQTAFKDWMEGEAASDLRRRTEQFEIELELEMAAFGQDRERLEEFFRIAPRAPLPPTPVQGEKWYQAVIRELSAKVSAFPSLLPSPPTAGKWNLPAVASGSIATGLLLTLLKARLPLVAAGSVGGALVLGYVVTEKIARDMREQTTTAIQNHYAQWE